MAKEKAHPDELRDDQPEPTDDLATANAKSGSVDERIPESFGVDTAAGIEEAAPAAMLPQAGVSGVQEEMGPGEAVLEKERQHLRIPRQPG